MYLNIGGNYMVDIHNIVAFFKTNPKRIEKQIHCKNIIGLLFL